MSYNSGSLIIGLCSQNSIEQFGNYDLGKKWNSLSIIFEHRQGLPIYELVVILYPESSLESYKKLYGLYPPQ